MRAVCSGGMLLLAGLLGACQNDYQRVQLVAQGNLANQQQGKDVEILYSDSGAVKARVLAPNVVREEGAEPTTTMTGGVKAYFLNAEQVPTSTLRSDRAIRREKARTIECLGRVVVTNVQGDTLLTERLVWDEMKATLYSDKFVTIKRPKETIYGDGFESNQTFTRYEIKNIKGIIAAPAP